MVNIASMAAFNISPTSASVLYSTTKSAIVRMTESLAVEWAKHNINVNAIAPGIFHSEMADAMLERIGDVSKGSAQKKNLCSRTNGFHIAFLGITFIRMCYWNLHQNR